MIVRRHGEDLAAVIPLEYLVREALARQETQRLTAQIDGDLARTTLRSAQESFDGAEITSGMRG